MSWRPEGWKSLHRFVITPSFIDLVKAQDTDEVKFYQNEAYELGADAMLEALRKEEEVPQTEVSKMIFEIWRRVGIKGKIVFIPDDV